MPTFFVVSVPSIETRTDDRGKAFNKEYENAQAKINGKKPQK